ncbi:MAG: hypothetical protein R3F59_27290 [Myxococcota bacterium]
MTLLALLAPPAAAQEAPVQDVLDAGRILLDDREPTAARVDAARTLGATGDASVRWLLRAASLDPDPAVRRAAALAALALPGDEGPEVAVRVVSDRDTPRDVSSTVLDALGAHGTEAAARGLFAVASDRHVPATVRAEALDVLDRSYPELADALGPRPGVVDPLGGAAFAVANGVAGGVVFSSLGVFGAFEGAEVIGAVGGSAVGLGSGILYASTSPLTLGEGLAYASGVSWGLTYGLWATTTVHGGARWRDDPSEIARPGAVWRGVGVAVGAGLGGWALSRQPRTWDVLEVDTAGYLGSAVALGAVGLAAYRPPAPKQTPYGGTRTGSAYEAYRLDASRWLAGSQLVGASLGLGAGLLLADRWDLDWNDAAFGLTLGAEAAWVGTFLPGALGVDDEELKGTIRLPWNAAIAGGLAVSELAPVPLSRTAATGWGAVTGNAIGGGLPLVAGATDPRVIDGVMVPVGVAGTAAAYLLAPHLAPDVGDAVVIGVGTAVAGAEGALVGGALSDLGTFEADQAAGLAALSGGVAGAALLGLAPVLDTAPDEAVLLGTAAAWGGTYGALLPEALRFDPRASGVLLPAAVGTAVGMAGTGLAMLPARGLAPRHAVVPELAAGGRHGGRARGGARLGGRRGRGARAVLGSTVGGAAGPSSR